MSLDLSRFCITGYPRSRTAWLAALMCAHGIETFHEYPPFFSSLAELRDWLLAGTKEKPRGYVDGFSIIHHADLLRAYFHNHPIVVIARDPLEVRASWERWGGPISDAQFTKVVESVERFVAENDVFTLPYADLDRYEAVNKLVMYCTGRPLKTQTWKLFHYLKIELHEAKARL